MTFLSLVINPFFINSFRNFLYDFFFFVYIKKYKNLSAEYYPENKAGVLKTTKKARERYQSFSKEEKEKKQQYGYERYKSLPEDEKQRIVEYRKNIE